MSAIRPLVEMSAVKMKGHTFTEDDKIVTYKEQIKVVAASGNNNKKKAKYHQHCLIPVDSNVRKLNLRTSSQGRSEGENSPVHQCGLRADLLESSF